MNKIFTIYLALASLTTALPGDLPAQEAIEIGKEVNFLGLTPPTPIAITGFSGEVAHALNFDLTVMGCTNVPPDAAKYLLSGSNNGNVQGQLSLGGGYTKSHAGENIRADSGRSVLFSKVYSGPSVRAQAHRLADDVVLKLTGVN